jgi:hypothetical protein
VVSKEIIAKWAEEHGWQYQSYYSKKVMAQRLPKVTAVFKDLGIAALTIAVLRDYCVSQTVSGSIDGTDFLVGDIPLPRSSSSSICAIPLQGPLPEFEIVHKDAEDQFLIRLFSPFLGLRLGGTRYKSGNKEFDKHFRVRCANKDFAKVFLTPDLMSWLLSLPGNDPLVRFGISIVSRSAFIFTTSYTVLAQAPSMVASMKRFVNQLPPEVWQTTWE